MRVVVINKFIFVLLLVGNVLSQDTPWVMHVIDDSFSGADGVRLADVNGDGLMDITTGWEEGGRTKVYLNPGFEGVKQQWPSVLVAETPDVEDAVFADLDGDGAVDVISSTEGNSEKIFINWAPSDAADYLDAAKWTSEIIPASDGMTRWMFAIPMQVDGLNGLDIIAGSKDPNAVIGWFEAPANPRNLSDWKWHTISPAVWIMSLYLRDMDGDGDLDVVTSDRKTGATRGVRWMENPGPGAAQAEEWEIHYMGGRDVEILFMDMVDLDGDGLEDVVVPEYSNQKIIFIRRLDATGLNWESHIIDLPAETGRAKAVRVGDVNGDGTLDIVHSSNTGSGGGNEGVIWMTPKTAITDPEWDWHVLSGTTGKKFDRIELLDLDGDGDLDVLTCEENAGSNSSGLGVIWYENPSNIALSTEANLGTPTLSKPAGRFINAKFLFPNSNNIYNIKGQLSGDTPTLPIK